MKKTIADDIMKKNKSRFSKLTTPVKIARTPLYKKKFSFGFKKDFSKNLKTKIKVKVDTNFNASVKGTIIFVAALAIYYLAINLYYSGENFAQKADESFMQGDYFKTAQYYRKAISLKYTSADIYEKYGISLIKTGNYVLAESNLKKALALSPESPTALYNLANAMYLNACLVKLSEPSNEEVTEAFIESAYYLKEAIRVDPKMKEAYVLIGLCYREVGQYQEALFWYNKAVELFSKVEFYNLMGRTLVEETKYSDAIEVYRRAIDYDKDSFITYYNIGEAYTKINDINSAMQSYEKAIELNPDYVESYIKIGGIYMDNQQYEEALQWFIEALKVRPENAQANFFAGITAKSLNRTNEAVEYLKKAAYYGNDAAVNLLQNMEIDW